ncbi:hypothetical protein [Hyphomicrobium sp. DY-1]|uniref:hypothetical protein n=1 Tax=Hyphomicrobium sp. DY-1 TaxID=3075650 RepID=UPI0039C3E26A
MGIRFQINEQITAEQAHIRSLYTRISKQAEIAGNGRILSPQREAAEKKVAELMREINEHRKIIVAIQQPRRRDATPLI